MVFAFILRIIFFALILTNILVTKVTCLRHLVKNKLNNFAMNEESKRETQEENKSLVFVTKWPSMGVSKTRLIPALGEIGAFEFAQAMFNDLVHNISDEECMAEIKKILYFAPEEKYNEAKEFLEVYGGEDTWAMIPMIQGNQLTSTDLGAKLKQALKCAKEKFGSGPIAFIGMDTPHLSSESLRNGFEVASAGKAYICPASDGGYVLLILPCSANEEVFDNIRWSSESTCEDQKQSIVSNGIEVEEGDIYTDIDTIEDLLHFVSLLQSDQVLIQRCQHCHQALQKLQLM